MKKIKRNKKGKFTSFRSKVKLFLNRLVLTGALAMAVIGVYAYSSYNTAQANQAELNSLRAKVIKYQSEVKDKNEGTIKTIEKIAKEENFDAELAIKIAACESYLNPYFVKINKNRSMDRGIFAFNSKFYKQVSNECAFNVACATKVFISEAKQGRIKNWLCYKVVR